MWPSQPSLPVSHLMQELEQLVEVAINAHMQSIFFQVRSVGDSMYKSDLEPWSKYLSGKQGISIDENWDPLEFLVRKTSEKKLDVHAWVNLFRAGIDHESQFTDLAMNHPCRNKTIAKHCHKHEGLLWMDPMSDEVQQHIVDVVLDIVRRYVHYIHNYICMQ